MPEQPLIPGSSEGPFLDVFVWEGLGNRLRALASAAVVARYRAYRLRLNWAVDSTACGAGWSDLFSTPIEPAPAGPNGYGIHAYCYGNDLGRCVTLHLLFRSGEPLTVLSVFSFRPWQISLARYKAGVSSFYRSLEPVPVVAERVGSIVAQHDNFRNVVGVHIRRRDWVAFGGGPERHVAPRQAYVRVLSRYLRNHPEKRLFVATDEDSERVWLSEVFPCKVLEHSCGPIDRGSVSSMQEALVDWLLLSRCECVFAPAYSSFSREAAKVHNVRFIVVRSVRNTVRLWLQNNTVQRVRRWKLVLDRVLRSNRISLSS